MSPRPWPALTFVVILVGCSGAPSPAPEPTPSSSTPAPTTPRERDAIDLALDAAWNSDPHRYACGAVTGPVIDSLADVVQTVVETDRLSAVLMAQSYRRERCPQR